MSTQLFKDRQAIAESEFEAFEFGDVEIAATSGWESDGSVFSRVIFIESEEKGFPSEKASFQVIFSQDGADVQDVSRLICKTGNEIGFRPKSVKAINKNWCQNGLSRKRIHSSPRRHPK